ncbi:hypothetical protein B0H14DRAFT_3155771 [Mycena olivaceomarginata]|nr:hypothetical protein B0H14DRAFT_3155771 [Mycena olivaceomarginata]
MARGRRARLRCYSTYWHRTLAVQAQRAGRGVERIAIGGFPCSKHASRRDRECGCRGVENDRGGRGREEGGEGHGEKREKGGAGMGVGVVGTAHGDGDANCTRCATAWVERVGQYGVGDREHMGGAESPEWSRGELKMRTVGALYGMWATKSGVADGRQEPVYIRRGRESYIVSSEDELVRRGRPLALGGSGSMKCR